jgi:heterodisulfide reductase subunit B
MTRAYSLYPGCTLHSTGLEYGVSARAVCQALDVELIELDDWNCCGASSAHSLDAELADALPARDLLLAQERRLDIAIPCAACYGRLRSAQARLRRDAAFRQRMEQAVGRRFAEAAQPRSLLEILAGEVPRQEIARRVRRPLAGLRPVSYYGCLLLRPPEIAGGWDDTERPAKLDGLLTSLGAQPQPWSYATDCCGASMTLNRSDLVLELVGRLLDAAADAGANCIVTACPLCQANLDTRQGRRRMAVFYFTELIGLAMGLRGMGQLLSRHITDPRPTLRDCGLDWHDLRD